jgi:dihydrofolate synthase/folylpolyglutamate synthase
MSYSETINYLYNLQKHGIKFGLGNISWLMSLLDDPHKSFLSVHVAGTNGKGSVSAIIASILRSAGLRVGLFTSPHIVSFAERIRINGEEISEDEIIELADEIRCIVERHGDFSPTFFEIVTAMALLYFERKKIDIAVMEVGMGGRLDATNIITPEVSVITDISYDHMEFLGSTLKEIAHEKTGIIKKGIPVVTSYQETEAIKVIEKKAIENDTDLYVYGRDFFSVLRREDFSGICFDYHSRLSSQALHPLTQKTVEKSRDSSEGHHNSHPPMADTIHNLVLPLMGEHQMQNASVAIKAATIVLNNIPYLPPHPPLTKGGLKGDNLTKGEQEGGYDSSPISHHFIREGLKNVRWPGRLEIVKEEPVILIDGAHNPAAANALSAALKKFFSKKYKRIIIVLGIMGDKDVKGIMEPLLPLASEIILTSPEYSRAASPEKLAGTAASLGFFNVRIAPTVRDALEMAIRIADCGMQNAESELKTIPNSAIRNQKSLILVTGSFYTIGEAKEAIGIKGILARLRE